MKVLKKENIALRRATVQDAELLASWWNNEEIMRYAGFSEPWNLTAQEIASMLEKETDEIAGRWIIEIDGMPRGEMIYTNKENNIFSIGVKMCALELNDKGYGASALKILMDYLSGVL